MVEERLVHTVVKKLHVKEGKTSPKGDFCMSMLGRRSNFQDKKKKKTPPIIN